MPWKPFNFSASMSQCVFFITIRVESSFQYVENFNSLPIYLLLSRRFPLEERLFLFDVLCFFNKTLYYQTKPLRLPDSTIIHKMSKLTHLVNLGDGDKIWSILTSTIITISLSKSSICTQFSLAWRSQSDPKTGPANFCFCFQTTDKTNYSTEILKLIGH